MIVLEKKNALCWYCSRFSLPFSSELGVFFVNQSLCKIAINGYA